MTALRVGVIGAGVMGRGIAQVAIAAPDAEVVLVDSRQEALDGAGSALAREWARQVTAGSLGDAEHDRRLGALTTSTRIADLNDCALVIEAVSERPAVKTEVLAEVSRQVAAEAIVATNTSSLSVTQLSSSIEDPTRFFGLHFFNPVPRMALVEVVSTPLSSPIARERLSTIVRDHFSKTPIDVDDRPGFVVNALLVPYLLSAARMIDTGYADAQTVDEGMRLGAGHPMGPLALCDLIGLDVLCDIADALYAQTRDPASIVPGSLRRMVWAGQLGRKSGRGFHDYTSGA